jgi:hypothetical protein
MEGNKKRRRDCMSRIATRGMKILPVIFLVFRFNLVWLNCIILCSYTYYPTIVFAKKSSKIITSEQKQ